MKQTPVIGQVLDLDQDRLHRVQVLGEDHFQFLDTSSNRERSESYRNRLKPVFVAFRQGDNFYNLRIRAQTLELRQHKQAQILIRSARRGRHLQVDRPGVYPVSSNETH